MSTPFGHFRAIAGLAIKDLLRQPVCLLLVLTASVLIVFLPQAFAYQLGQQNTLARDSALAFQLVLGVLLIGYAAASTLHSELASGTLITVFSRPVGRVTFFIAKLAAVCVLIALFIWTTAASALLGTALVPRYFATHAAGLAAATLAFPSALAAAALLNFRLGRSFPAAALLLLPMTLSLAALFAGSRSPAGEPVPLASQLDWNLLSAGIMAGLALLILAAIALTLATRLKPAPTIAWLALLFFSGLIADYIASLCAGWPLARFVIKALLPDMQEFWMADELVRNDTIAAATLWHGATYTLAYCTGATCLGILCFRRREF